MRFLRAIKRTRWNDDPVDKSAALLDLAPIERPLSFWGFENQADEERIIVALASTRRYLSRLDYVVFEEFELYPLGIQCIQSQGETPYASVNRRYHYDLAVITDRQIDGLIRIISNSERKTYRPIQLKELLIDYVKKGHLDTSRMERVLLGKLCP